MCWEAARYSTKQGDNARGNGSVRAEKQSGSPANAKFPTREDPIDFRMLTIYVGQNFLQLPHQRLAKMRSDAPPSTWGSMLNAQTGHEDAAARYGRHMQVPMDYLSRRELPEPCTAIPYQTKVYAVRCCQASLQPCCSTKKASRHAQTEVVLLPATGTAISLPAATSSAVISSPIPTAIAPASQC